MAGPTANYRNAPHGRYVLRLSPAQERVLGLMQSGYQAIRKGQAFEVGLIAENRKETTNRNTMRALTLRRLVEIAGDEWRLTAEGMAYRS